MCPLKAKYIRDVKFQASSCLKRLIRSMWCLMLNSRKSPEVRVFYRFCGWISCIEYKPVRKVGSTLVSKGQCFETPAFDAFEASKIARSCFRFSMSCGCSYWILKFQIRLAELESGYWILKFQNQIAIVSNQGRVPGFGSARIVRSVPQLEVSCKAGTRDSNICRCLKECRVPGV